MMSFDELCQPRAARGLQAMMLRWEQLQPVNAVHVAWLRNSFRPSEIEAATTRALQRLLNSSPGRALDQAANSGDLFEFSHSEISGAWTGDLQSAVTRELNTHYIAGRPPIRISAFDLPQQGQFLTLAYRHAIADARSITLLLHEIIHYLSSPAAKPPGYAAQIGSENLDQLFPLEYRWRRIPAVARNLATEYWKSRRCTRLSSNDSANLRMEFRMQHTALPLGILKSVCRRFGVTVNDLVLAAMMEWFAREYPGNKSRRCESAMATLVDLSSRATVPLPQAFGQYLTSFVVRAPATIETPFEELIRLIAAQTRSCKRLSSLLLNARGFEFLSHEWDLIPLVRRPTYLPAVLPRLAGVSNVNIPRIIGRPEQSLAIRNYFRGTCVTNLLPMMLSIMTFGNTYSLTTTHRPALFTAAQADDVAAHVTRRLFGEELVHCRVAA